MTNSETGREVKVWGNRIGERIANEILMLLRASKKYTREVSLFEPIGVDKDGEAVSLVDVIEMENREVLEDIILSQDIRELYEAYEDCLKEQEKLVVGMRYGLFGKTPKTQREIALQLGISRSYPSVIIGIKLGKPLNGLRLYPCFLSYLSNPNYLNTSYHKIPFRYTVMSGKTDRKTKGEHEWQKL